jgi:hypothetical protein
VLLDIFGSVIVLKRNAGAIYIYVALHFRGEDLG